MAVVDLEESDVTKSPEIGRGEIGSSQGGKNHRSREEDHDDDRRVGDEVQDPAVDVIAHDPPVIHQKEHENQDEREEHAVDHLRVEHDGD